LDRLSEARRWFSEAEWDLGTAKDLCSLRRYNASAFYAQQAAEKAVKALLYALGQMPIGHSVRQLPERFAGLTGHDVSSLLSAARELDRHYVPSRYPNALPSGTPHEAYDEEAARRAISCAKTIIDFVRRYLSGLGL